MSRIAIIGAGVSGLTMGRLLAPRASVTVYESASRPGGLIKCERVDGNLFHTCGGHVFNTRRQDVLDMFWSIFDRDRDFILADRNSAVRMPDGKEIPYPVENHAYMLDDGTLRRVIADVARMRGAEGKDPANFEEFLRRQFGTTLYDLYFGPYNRKVWRRDLSTVPLSWLEGKLPMPTPEEMLYNNIRRVKEKAFVHSTFYYERRDGSQFLADKLAEGLDVRYSTPVSSIERSGGKWDVDGEEYDAVVYCGNIKQLPAMLGGVDIQPFVADIEALESHGT
ncbi:MAG: NAD(P)-binding protein, partial [Duncaniella sp.]|nr:NAD(P)-binding protein [Duncaniella sp.]